MPEAGRQERRSKFSFVRSLEGEEGAPGPPCLPKAIWSGGERARKSSPQACGWRIEMVMTTLQPWLCIGGVLVALGGVAEVGGAA